jgi:hypothetical protein
MARVADEFASRISATISAGAAQAAAQEKVADAKAAAKAAQAAYDAAVKKSGKNSTAAKNALTKLNAANTAAAAANSQLKGIVIPTFANGSGDNPIAGVIGAGSPQMVTPLNEFQAAGAGPNGATIIYNAAPNQSIDAEQALFQAMKRAKVVAAW